MAQQLAQLTLAATDPNQHEVRRKRLAELNEDKEQLEQKLAQLSQAFRRGWEAANVKPDQLTRLLTSDTAIVEFRRINILFPPENGGGELASELQYDAFVVRPPVRQAEQQSSGSNWGACVADRRCDCRVAGRDHRSR